MKKKKVHKHLGIGPQLAREFRSMSEERRKELEAHIGALCATAGINPDHIECIEYARVRQVITVYTALASLEVGLSPSFGPPRRRLREFMGLAFDPLSGWYAVPRGFPKKDEAALDALIIERPMLIRGILQEVSPELLTYAMSR
jgi:hypothetical protein